MHYCGGASRRDYYGSFIFANCYFIFLTFYSHPLPHKFPTEIKETLFLLLSVCEVSDSVLSISRLGSCAMLLALMELALVK